MVHLRGLLETPRDKNHYSEKCMDWELVSCCILPFLNNYILECNLCSVFIDRICLCCKTLTQELPVPGLCLGDCVSSTSLDYIPNPTQRIFRPGL